MKVITEERLRKLKSMLGDSDLKLSMVDLIDDLLDELVEIDTLTVSKLRPMCDAPSDGSLFLSKHYFAEELEETWANGECFDTSQYCGLFEEDFDGWVPKTIYKPESTGNGE